jgi:hypothetical protein
MLIEIATTACGQHARHAANQLFNGEAVTKQQPPRPVKRVTSLYP